MQVIISIILKALGVTFFSAALNMIGEAIGMKKQDNQAMSVCVWLGLLFMISGMSI